MEAGLLRADWMALCRCGSEGRKEGTRLVMPRPPRPAAGCGMRFIAGVTRHVPSKWRAIVGQDNAPDGARRSPQWSPPSRAGIPRCPGNATPVVKSHDRPVSASVSGRGTTEGSQCSRRTIIFPEKSFSQPGFLDVTCAGVADRRRRVPHAALSGPIFSPAAAQALTLIEIATEIER